MSTFYALHCPCIYNHYHGYEDHDDVDDHAHDDDDYDDGDGDDDEMMMFSPEDERVTILLGLKADRVCFSQ